MNATIQGYLDACSETESNVEDVQYKIARVMRELESLKTELVCAKVADDLAKGILRQANDQEVVVEVAPRERDIAYMKGITLKVGDPLTDDARRAMFAAPALKRFTSID